MLHDKRWGRGWGKAALLHDFAINVYEFSAHAQLAVAVYSTSISLYSWNLEGTNGFSDIQTLQMQTKYDTSQFALNLARAVFRSLILIRKLMTSNAASNLELHGNANSASGALARKTSSPLLPGRSR